MESQPLSRLPSASSVAQLGSLGLMSTRTISLVGLLAIAVMTIAASPASKRVAVRVSHFGYPRDPDTTANTRLGLGDHNNILNEDSVAVTPDLGEVFPFDSKVFVGGKFLGFRHSTLSSKLHYTIAVYDPKGQCGDDFDSWIELRTRR
jgi:hypothetical protein